MSDYYPAGVDRLPGEEIFECVNCGATIDPLKYGDDVCPECGEDPCELNIEDEDEDE